MAWCNRLAGILCLSLAATSPAYADSAAQLGRDVEMAEGVRAVKNLQASYNQYAQFGRWREMAALYAEQGEAVIGKDDVKGRAAIRDYLAKFNDGKEGLAPGALNTRLLFEQTVNVAADGKSAKGRWRELSLLASGKGDASWDGGILENEYVKEGGVWKISRLVFSPQFGGPYEKGWHNYDADLKVTPYHFTADQAGTPVILSTDESGPAPALSALAARIGALNDEDKVRNLQNAYGYYVDEKMWDDVTDLFAADGALGDAKGVKAIRALLEKDGPVGLKHGELNDHIQIGATVRIAPGGLEARARGIELGLLGDVDHGQKGWWSVSVFDNRFVKGKDGKWRIQQMRIVPLMKTDFYQGWGKSRLVEPGPMPAFLPGLASGTSIAAQTPNLAELRRQLSRSIGFDAVENISSAFGDWIADDQWEQLGALFAPNGMRQYPSVGSYKGPKRIAESEGVRNGFLAHPRTNIGPHIMAQPVIDIAEDAHTARYRTRLFQLGASADRPGNVSGGMYNNQAVLDHGIWKVWSVAIDEFYYAGDLIEGWARTTTQRPDPRPTKLDTVYLPDIPRSVLGHREEGIHGGPTASIDWPNQKPMWFFYANPVSGRVPPNYWPDCVTCVYDPKTSAKANGY